jgi:hypothetical protein
MLRNDENSSLRNWILARNFLIFLFWHLILRADCSQLQDASIKPLCRVCSQKQKFLWPCVWFIEVSEYSMVEIHMEIGTISLPVKVHPEKNPQSNKCPIAILSSWAERNLRCCPLYSSAGSAKIKIRTSSWHNANWALCHDEVRNLIFDDPAEL